LLQNDIAFDEKLIT